ncbi:hypothetical protein WG66_013691, partial [Moniliophthora roreri]
VQATRKQPRKGYSEIRVSNSEDKNQSFGTICSARQITEISLPKDETKISLRTKTLECPNT